MDDADLTLWPVGVAHTPYETPAAAPHQGFADDTDAEIEIFDEYADELSGIADAVRITVVYWAHMADRMSRTEPDGTGAFARRSPNRPNPLSICVCTVYDADGQRLQVGGLDAVDGSPVLDIKPSLQTER
ncbi:tRNA (N6-threonylcarbamoyladenosine(37)-N6)-methyltransferase TrmO [Haloplanus salilacus]|jgi:tRNA-Thr(GGU) m(6)t(6)A37 methyltransferase TsaA|uniref:tRNA (N6-threonylcarbamoyladenosine(37)-N6)-methyltransferase TrmO n=1 Tax=Haloplanus salilacus TaxID=2949994 RepID=UPI0030CD37BA